MSFDSLKSDMLQLIKLSGQIGKYEQTLLHHGDLKDKRNLNPEKCERIRLKLASLQERFDFLNNKWF